MNEKLQEISNAVDTAILETSLLHAQVDVLQKMIFGVYAETLSDEQYQAVTKRFQSELKLAFEQGLTEASELVRNKALAIQYQFDLFSAEQANFRAQK